MGMDFTRGSPPMGYPILLSKDIIVYAYDEKWRIIMIVDIKSVQEYKYGTNNIRLINIEGALWFYAVDIINIVVKDHPSNYMGYVYMTENTELDNAIKYILVDYNNLDKIIESDNRDQLYDHSHYANLLSELQSDNELELAITVNVNFLDKFIDDINEYNLDTPNNTIVPNSDQILDLKKFIQDRIVSVIDAPIMYYDYSTTDYFKDLKDESPSSTNTVRSILKYFVLTNLTDKEEEKEVFISAHDIFASLHHQTGKSFLDLYQKTKESLMLDKDIDMYIRDSQLYLNDLGITEIILRSSVLNRFKLVHTLYKTIYPSMIEAYKV